MEAIDYFFEAEMRTTIFQPFLGVEKVVLPREEAINLLYLLFRSEIICLEVLFDAITLLDRVLHLRRSAKGIREITAACALISQKIYLDYTLDNRKHILAALEVCGKMVNYWEREIVARCSTFSVSCHHFLSYYYPCHRIDKRDRRILAYFGTLAMTQRISSQNLPSNIAAIIILSAKRYGFLQVSAPELTIKRMGIPLETLQGPLEIVSQAHNLRLKDIVWDCYFQDICSDCLSTIHLPDGR